MKQLIKKVNSWIDYRMNKKIKHSALSINGQVFSYPYSKISKPDEEMMLELKELSKPYRLLYRNTFWINTIVYGSVMVLLLACVVLSIQTSWHDSVFKVIIGGMWVIAGFLSLPNFFILLKTFSKSTGRKLNGEEKEQLKQPLVKLETDNLQTFSIKHNRKSDMFDENDKVVTSVAIEELLNKLNTLLIKEFLGCVITVGVSISLWQQLYINYGWWSLALLVNCIFWNYAFNFYGVLVSFYYSSKE
ncbi:unnamed protein product [Fructobacillus tropaeoli]|uniref:hypothetical protein n=1 Tax=Fructobacillus tropaeoli TaxID=709323 RepID=UPI002DA652F3|nr:unnamed protein product [Fructobacillus tropaeoli]